jgi:Tol biopolymer transport system component
MPGKGRQSEIRRPLAALGIVCVLTAGCTGAGEPVGAAPTPADSSMPTPIPEDTRSLGSLAYGVDGDIYVADWDGSNAVRIANGRPPKDCSGLGEYWGEGPIWSPDGRYLAYRHTECESARDEWWDVVISDPKGNVVATFPGEGWQIAWSPDSTRVAVWVRWGETIGVYGLDGVRQTLLTVPPAWKLPGDVDPVWLPDGASLMVPHGVEIPLDGSAPGRLPWADRHAAWVTYSPDGSRIAYATRQSLVVAEADGSFAHEVFGDYAALPQWSPTGDRIAFVSFVSTPFVSKGQLRLLDVATGTVTLLAETGESIAAGAGFKFSPEGDRILFSTSESQGRGPLSLWSVNADGSDLRRLVVGTAWGDWRSPGQTR